LGGSGVGGTGFGNSGMNVSTAYGGGTTHGGDATVNTGSGGGGVRDTYNGSTNYTRAGNGSSGIVIVRYAV
jgi:hypothetical protein